MVRPGPPIYTILNFARSLASWAFSNVFRPDPPTRGGLSLGLPGSFTEHGRQRMARTRFDHASAPRMT